MSNPELGPLGKAGSWSAHMPMVLPEGHLALRSHRTTSGMGKGSTWVTQGAGRVELEGDRFGSQSWTPQKLLDVAEELR